MPDLGDAYGLQTPDDSRALYATWAGSYDQSFAAARGYVYPAEIAAQFRAHAGQGDAPILDIGAGTGLVAEHLAGEVDALDISPEMLGQAGAKGRYRHLIQADLTQALPIPDASYGGFISAGTFTHGHVGPVCLPELMRISRPGALFCLGINAQVFDALGFGSAFAALSADGAIGPIHFARVPIYRGADHDHAADTALIALFRRAPDPHRPSDPHP